MVPKKASTPSKIIAATAGRAAESRIVEGRVIAQRPQFTACLLAAAREGYLSQRILFEEEQGQMIGDAL